MCTRPVAVLLLLTLGVAGCGQSDSSERLQGTTIEVLAFWSGGEQEAFTKVYELFERETGADVRYVGAGDELATILQTRIEGGNPPSVAIAPQPGLVRHLARTGHLTPLTGEVAAEVDSGYEPAWRQLGSVDGQLYAVPFKATNKSTFWYNDRVLSRFGLTPPQTWEELLQLCDKLSDHGVTPVSIGGADGWVLTDWFENVYLQEAGAKLYDQLSEHQIAWTHESVRRALEKLAQLFGNDRLIDGGRAGALQTEFAASVVNVFGPRADAAMVYEGDFVAAVIRKDTNAQIGDMANFFPFPGPRREAVVVGGDQAVALKDDRATMEFMRYLASAKAGKEWARHGGFLSPNRLVSLDSYPDEVTRKLADQIMNAGNNIRFDMSDLYPAQFGATKGAGEWKAMQDFLNNPGDIDAVMSQLEAAASKTMR
jgi:alpha-glucoside transport system substrate-binding protein